jgi:LysR family transcriptional regulator, carnitine catabolism transcriptional activator
LASIQEVPDLSVKHLRAIVALARFGSFIAAASYLRLSQPGFSRIIQQAERLLGVPLFVRGTRSVAQTAAGLEFIPAAERLLGEILQQTQTIRSLDGERHGQLIIASLMSISHHVLPAALVEYRKQYPKMHIQIREASGSPVHEDVRKGIADFGIGNVTGLHDTIAVESVIPETCCVVLPPDHPLAARPHIRLKELSGEPLVSMSADTGLRRTIDIMANSQGVSLDHSLVTNQFTTLFDFVASGLGIAIVPVSALPHDRAIVTRALRPTMIRQIGILHLRERPLSPASQSFLEIFRPRFIAAIRNSPYPVAEAKTRAKKRA